jgi:type IV pilus assembly protein PilA
MFKIVIALVLLLLVAIPLAINKFGEETQNNHNQAMYLANGLSMTSTFKAYIGEYYFNTGKLPSNNSEAGLPNPENFSSDAVKSVEILNGTIITTYTEKSGIDGGRIYLILEPSDFQMQWRCETASYKLINKYIPQCNYVSKQK